ncbi:MAG: peptidoglycan DD-metalloendopeptidase family protein [Bacteroides sp.]|nr:peptidoglycan DD-metalloendopeptidase family protein [Roseburia sp.]MCM1346058.1 peptidoglycan DD-metalloendopeptidase family protein [Bacteroides sp.]MCM1420580.1 peptidoglycan DD-metalloendopeptidase family protein [Bacteroides sp.]
MKQRILIILLCLCTVATASSQTKRKTTVKKKAATTVVDKKTKLRKEAAAAQNKRKQSQQQAANLNRSIKANLDSVLILDNRIGRQQASIDSLNAEITRLNRLVSTLQKELSQLERELKTKKESYASAIIRLRRHRSVQNKMMFIFSADNFAQIIRRMRYLQEYATYQKAQGVLIKEKQQEVKEKQNELLAAKAQKQKSLQTVEANKLALTNLKNSCQKKIDYLNKNLTTVQRQITEYQKQEASLNAEIDRIIKQEIEAERKRKEEAARKKAEAEKRERERKLAEAKAAKERALAAQKAAKSEAEKKAAKKELERADKDVRTAEKNNKEGEKIAAWKSDNSSDARLSSNFASNKGKLPMPVTGSYSVVGHYGKYTVSGLRNVQLDNKGIDIRGQQGAAARAIFDGEVSSVFQYGTSYIVMLRHGSYISVYSGLSSVSVKKGQKVSTRQTLGNVGKDANGNTVLHFQLRKESTRLNPEQWVR